MRKKIIQEETAATPSRAGELDLDRLATVHVTSESPDAPVDHAFDGRRGPGGSRWIAGTTGTQTLTLSFDAPQAVRRVLLEVEERDVSRTQEVVLAISHDGERSWRELLRQEFHFSPPGTAFERETWTVNAPPVTHLRLQIVPDKGGQPCRASVTTLALE